MLYRRESVVLMLAMGLAGIVQPIEVKGANEAATKPADLVISVLPMPANIWINESMTVTAEVFAADQTRAMADPNWFDYTDFENKHPHSVPGYVVWWSATDGSFETFAGPNAKYIASDYSGPATEQFSIVPVVTPQGTAPPIARGQDPLTRLAAATQPSVSSVEQPASPDHAPSFDREMAAFQSASDRDSRIDHLQRALALRPNDPDNIVLEFKIATLIGQNSDPEHGQYASPEKALPLFEGIVQRYDHKKYYSADFPNYTDAPQMMVVRSAILAASELSAAGHDPQKAREYALMAMADLQWTYETRKTDWLQAPKPEFNALFFGNDGPEEKKWESRVKYWEQRQLAAAAGKVFGVYESEFVRAVISVHGMTFGPRHPGEVAPIMRNLIARFPDTPIAIAAQEEIDRAARQSAGNK